MLNEWTEIYSRESLGRTASIGVKILVAVGRPLTPADKEAACDAGDILHKKLGHESVRQNAEIMAEVAQERRDLIGLFPCPIYVKTIPNGYCGPDCCPHRPWFIVTTPAGPITIGWRKRVISIDWSESDIIATADELFPLDDVTKSKHLIHAWEYEKAREYVAKLLASADSASDAPAKPDAAGAEGGDSHA
jgi:hypothetical protein